MNAEEYTPTTAVIRTRASRDDPDFIQARAEFDRWLAQHDAEVRANALGGNL